MAAKQQGTAASGSGRRGSTGSSSSGTSRTGGAAAKGGPAGSTTSRGTARAGGSGTRTGGAPPAAGGAATRATGSGAPSQGTRASSGSSRGTGASAQPAVARAAKESERPHRSAVEALLAAHPGDTPAPDRGRSGTGPDPEATQAAAELVDAARSLVATTLLVPTERTTADEPVHPARHAAPGGATGDVVPLDPRTGLPPAQDVALGVASLVAERLWEAGSAAIAWGNGIVAWSISFARAISPQVANVQADARLQRLAARGQRVRQERAEALAAGFTAAIMSAATSDPVRDMTVAAIEQATDDVLDVVLPAMLEAITERETQDKLDELMAGLLLRQLPAALEKTIPQVMLRTATRPAAGLMPFLGGVLPR